MDERLNGYINSLEHRPPAVSENKILKELARRRKRMELILLSLAGLLWTLALYAVSFRIGMENKTLGIAMLCVISAGYMCSGFFAGIVLKYRKADL